MFSLDDVSRIITLNRGDTAEFPVFINEGTAWSPIRYHLSDYDTVYLGIMENGKSFEQAIVKKVYNKYSGLDEDGDLLIKLNPIDTLHLRPGKYFYSIKLKTINPETLDVESVQTIIPDTTFYLI